MTSVIKSFQGVLLGIVLFLISFGVIYWNEGRVDMSKIAKKAVVIEASNLGANADSEGQLVSASGTVSSEPLIGDDLYLKPGAYFTLEREVDVYAWVEKSESVTKTDSTGKETTETTYSYVTDWVDSPADSKDFHTPEGHTNPPVDLNDLTVTATSAKLEQYNFSPTGVRAPAPNKISLKADKLALTANASLASDAYIYVRKSATGTYAAPQLGDLRVSYSGLAVPFEGTLFGQQHGSDIQPYVSEDGDELYRVFDGTHDQAVAKMHSEYKGALWAFRLVAFLMMWFGLMAFFGPVSAVLDFIPVVGGVGKALIAAVTFVVALLLSAVAIIVSAILHSIVAVIIVVILVLGAVVGGGALLKKNKVAHKAA